MEMYAYMVDGQILLYQPKGEDKKIISKHRP